jgi:hypothetical protein
MRRLLEMRRALVFFVVTLVVAGSACILGPKQDDPANDSTGLDAGGAVDGAKADPDAGYALDTSSGADAAADAPPTPPDRCGEEADGGDAGDADATEGGCDARPDADAAADADAHEDVDAEADGVTGG